MGRTRKAATRYVAIWRNKFLTTDAKTITDMIEMLREAADDLQKMKKRGVKLDPDGGTMDDCAMLVTTDPVVAQEFKDWGFCDETEDTDEDDEDDDEEDDDEEE